jgi:hypothetical protein
VLGGPCSSRITSAGNRRVGDGWNRGNGGGAFRSSSLSFLNVSCFPDMKDLLEETVHGDVDENIQISSNEVVELISSIQEAQYFDASSMAPLTARSLVSTDNIIQYI